MLSIKKAQSLRHNPALTYTAVGSVKTSKLSQGGGINPWGGIGRDLTKEDGRAKAV